MRHALTLTGIRTGFIALVAGFALFGATQGASAFDDTERAEIGEIVREYLLANPEISAEIEKKVRSALLPDTNSEPESNVAELDTAVGES